LTSTKNTDGDTVRRFLFERFPVRGYVVHLDASWRALIEHHAYPDVVRDTLGEAAAATVLLASNFSVEASTGWRSVRSRARAASCRPSAGCRR
jgi:redox-regulated HSP33 family molecular chaperone